MKKRASLMLILAAGLVLWAWPTLAAEAEAPSALGEGLGPAIVKMLAALSLVLGLVLGLYWLARRFLPGPAASGPSAGLRMVGRLNLAPRKWVTLVEVGGKVLVLGVAEQSISLLASLEANEPASPAARPRPGFAGLLKKAQAAPASASEEKP